MKRTRENTQAAVCIFPSLKVGVWQNRRAINGLCKRRAVGMKACGDVMISQHGSPQACIPTSQSWQYKMTRETQTNRLRATWSTPQLTSPPDSSVGLCASSTGIQMYLLLDFSANILWIEYISAVAFLRLQWDTTWESQLQFQISSRCFWIILFKPYNTTSFRMGIALPKIKDQVWSAPIP